MKGRFKGVLKEACKIAVAAWSVTWIEPQVGKFMTDVNPAVTFLISALLAAVILEILLQVVCGWPRLNIEWSEKNIQVPIADIDARFNPKTSSCQPFRLDLMLPEQGWLGFQILKWLLTKGVTLEVSIQTVSVFPTCEFSSKLSKGDLPAVRSIDRLRGFSITLDDFPSRPGRWHHADVRWRKEGEPGGDGFNIDYHLHHENWRIKLLSRLLVRCTSNAHSFRVIGL